MHLSVSSEQGELLLQPDIGIDLEMQRGPAREWVARKEVQQEVARLFRKFLLDYTDDNEDKIYVERLAEMCSCELISSHSAAVQGHELAVSSNIQPFADTNSRVYV